MTKTLINFSSVCKQNSSILGIIGGFVQGTCGVSAPVALGYLILLLRIETNSYSPFLVFWRNGWSTADALPFFFFTWELFFVGILALAPDFGNVRRRKLTKTFLAKHLKINSYISCGPKYPNFCKTLYLII